MCKICNGETKHGKPYCIKHVTNMPYIKKLKYDIRDDIRLLLSTGAKQIGMVARECNVNLRLVEKAIRKMPEIKATKAKYNHTVVTLSLR